MTPEELQEVVAAVIAALKTNGKTIDQLTAVTSLADTDNLEISNGKKVSFGKLKELVADAVVVSAEEIKGWEIIDSTDDLPEDPTQVQQEKAYVLADVSTMYVYVGFGGDTLSGKYQSVNMKGAKGDSGVDLGQVAIADNLKTDDPQQVLSARQGVKLKGMIDEKAPGYYTYTESSLVKMCSCSITAGQDIGDTHPFAPSRGDNFGCMALKVHTGDKVEISTVGGGNPRAYVVTDTALTILAMSAASADTTTTPAALDITQDGYLIVNCFGGSGAANYPKFYVKLFTSVDRDEEYIHDNILHYENMKGDALTPQSYYTLSGGVGSTVDDTTTAHTDWWCMKTPVSAGQLITLYTKGGNNGRAYALTDSTLKITEVAAAGADYSLTPAQIHVEEDGFLFVNCAVAALMRFNLIKQADFGGSSSPTPTPSSGQDVPKYHNTQLPHGKGTLRVLAIGNSFMEDSLQYMGEFITASKLDAKNLCFYGLFRSSGSIQTWDEIYQSGDAIQPSNGTRCTRFAGEIDMGIANGNTLKEILSKHWDVVVLQQLSSSSTNYSTFEPYLTRLVGYIRRNCTNQNVAIAWHMTWSYKSDFSQTGPKGASGWSAICDTVKQQVLNNGIDIIIPTGTAIQNARNSSLNTNGEMTRDGQHLAYGVGRYVATATWWQTLVAPTLGVSVLGNSANHTIGSDEPETTYDSVAVTYNNRGTCQLCAFHATIDMFNVSSITAETLTAGTGTSILALNPAAKNILNNLSLVNYVRANHKVLTLAHISDTHGNSDNVARFNEFCDHYAGIIDVRMHTGDVVADKYEDAFDSSLYADTLLAVGNHDTASVSSGTFNWTAHQGLDSFNKFISPLYSGWGATLAPNAATSGLCYYYKDFPAKEIRLIVMDAMANFSSEDSAQLTWLTARLAEAKTNGYGVIIANHYIPKQPTLLSSPFSSKVGPTNASSTTDGAIAAVASFIADGGDFIAWVVGHEHKDYFGKITSGNTTQVVLCVATGSSTGTAQDRARVVGEKSQDLFNIYGFDKTAKTIKVFRVGSDHDAWARHQVTACINYATAEIIPVDDAAAGSGGGITQETDPTVPDWAKQPSKPSYTASEVGALPSSTAIPTKTSELDNDSGFLTQHQSIKSINGTSMVGSGNLSLAVPVSVVEVTGSTPTQELQPNTFYEFGSVTSLTVTLGTAVSGIASIYAFRFTAGQDDPTITLPQDVVCNQDLSLKTGDVCEFSIMDNLAVFQTWT